MRLLAPGGWLVSASCSFHVRRPEFLAMLAGAAADSGRRLTLHAKPTGNGSQYGLTSAYEDVRSGVSEVQKVCTITEQPDQLTLRSPIIRVS